MQPFIARKSEQGFSLVEGLVVVVLVGVLAAVSSPSFVGWRNKAEVTQAANNVQGALIEASRLAREKDKGCSVKMEPDPKDPDYILILSSDGCLLSTRTLPKKVRVASNITGENIGYLPKGETSFDLKTPSSTLGTIVLYKESTSFRKCVIITEPLAIVRDGNYQGNPSETVNETNCQKEGAKDESN